MRDRSSPVFFVSMLQNGAYVDFPARVLGIVIEDDEKKADTIKITVDNSDLSLLDSDLFDKTLTVRVRWGYPDDLSAEHTAIVQKVKGSLSLELECLDKGIVANKQARTRVFERMTRSQIVTKIATELGYTQTTRFIQTTTVVHDVIAQGGLTDAQFCKKLATAEGFEFYLSGGAFHWEERAFAVEPSRTLTYFLPPGVGDIESFGIDDDLVGRKGKTTVVGRDLFTKTTVAGTGSVATTERTKLGAVPAAPDVAGPAAPTGVLTFNAANEPVITFAPPSKTAPSSAAAQDVTQTTSASSAAAAKSEADAAYKRSSRGALKLSLSCVGDVALTAKRTIRVEGLGVRLSGNYYVTKATHTLGPGVYKTVLAVRRDSQGKGTGKAPAKDKGAENAKPAGDAGVLAPKLTFDPQTNEPVYTYGTGKKP